MKNFGLVILSAFVLWSCNPSDIKKANDSIQSADSLFTQVQEGVKSLDSISKIVNDSARLNSEIKNIQKQIEENSNLKTPDHHDIDSMIKVAKKMSGKVVENKELIKSVDSTLKQVSTTDSPVEVLKTITGVLDKISENSPTQEKNPKIQKNKESTTEKRNTEEQPVVSRISNPIIQQAQLEFNTEDIAARTEEVKVIINRYNARILTEKSSAQEGFQKKILSIAVPYNRFDEVMNELENTLGVAQYKTIESTGTDEVAQQMCKIDLTLSQDANAISPILGENTSTESTPNTAAGAIKKGWDGMKAVGLWMLPFWPLFLLLSGIGYFVYQYKKRKNEEATPVSNSTQMLREEIEEPKKTQTENHQEQEDISRFMPK